MRVLRFLLSSAVVFLIIGGIGAVIGREILLVVGVAQVRSAVSEMKSANRDRSQFARQCLEKGGSADAELLSTIQLRFISENEYVIEAVCAQFSLDPIIIARHTLPPLVMKVPGSAGIIWGDEPSGLALEVFGRTRAIIVEQQEAFYENYSPTMSLGRSPVSSCVAYGYSCCQEEVHQGIGNQISTASDCPRSCYSSCKQRPVVLSLATDPFMEVENRSVEVRKSETLSFSYVVSAPTLPATTTIEYGDGQTESLTELSGTFTHQYVCDQPSCQLTARLIVVDAAGSTSAPIAISSVTVFVKD